MFDNYCLQKLLAEDTSSLGKEPPGADPGFLEMGIICITEWGFHFADFISFFLDIQ